MENITETFNKTLQANVPEMISQVIQDVAPTAEPQIVSASTNAEISTSEKIPEQTVDVATIGATDDYYSCSLSIESAKTNPEKFQLLASHAWNASSPKYHVLATLKLPNAFFSSNVQPTWGQAQYFRLMRTSFHFKVMISPPMGAAGSLALSFIPPGVQHPTGTTLAYQNQTMLSFPSSYLDVRCSNEVDLVVPYTHFQNYVQYTKDADNAGYLVLWVFSQLRVPSSSSTNTEAAIYGALINLDFQCPRVYALADQGRRQKKRHILPPKPPVSKHVIVNSGPGSANLSNSLSTAQAESMALVGESTCVDYLTAGSNAAVSDLLQVGRNWNELFRFDYGGTTTAGTHITGYTIRFDSMDNIQGLIASGFDFFRGSFELKIVAFGSSLNSGRLQFSWQPLYTGTTAVSYQQARSLIYHTMDVGCPPSFMTIPFISTTWRKSVNSSYGRLSVHAVTPLTYTVACPSTIEVVVFIRFGPDFQLFCPRLTRTYFAQGLEDVDEDKVTHFINYEIQPVQISSESHTLIRSYFGRSIFMNEITSNTSVQSNIIDQVKSAIPLFRTCAFWTGELILTVVNLSENYLYISHAFNDRTPQSQLSMSAQGMVTIPPKASKMINCPYYAESPLQSTYSNAPLGRVYHLASAADTKFHLFVCFRNLSLFTPVGVYPWSVRSSRSWIRDLTEDGDVEENPGPKFIKKETKEDGGWVVDIDQKWSGILVRNHVQHHSWHDDPPPSPAKYVRYTHRRSILWMYTQFETATWTACDGKLMSQTFIQRRNLLGITHCTVRPSVWVRDLTTEGIEPNPGPVVAQQTRYFNSYIQSRQYGEALGHTWILDHFSNGIHHKNAFRVFQNNDRIPIFIVRFETIASFQNVTLIIKIGYKNHNNDWVFTRASSKLGGGIFPVFCPNISHFGVNKYKGFRSEWLSIHHPLNRNIACSISYHDKEVTISLYPSGGNQPHVFLIGEASWVKDLTADGDVEPNPGPQQWLSYRTNGRHDSVRWRREDLVLIDVDGLDIRMVGPIITIKRFRRDDGAKKVVYEYSNGGINPIEHVEWCHESCWVRDLTIDGDVEWNPGPSRWILEDEIGIDSYGEFTLRTYRQVFDSDIGVLSTGVIFAIKEYLRADGAKRIVLSFTDNMVDFEDWIYECHQHCWVRDLTRDGDVESNPGPWTPDTEHIAVVGHPGAGKSRCANLIMGHSIFYEQPNRQNPSYCDSIKTHGNLTVIDTGPLPNFKDIISKFVFVYRPITQNLYEAYVESLSRIYPNWEAHAVVYAEDGCPQDLSFKVMGRVANSLEKLKSMLAEVTVPYFSHICRLVYQDRGLYRHFGVRHQGKVFHLNTENILKSALTGEARVLVDLDPTSWIDADQSSYISAVNLASSGGIGVQFSIDSNCESWARHVMGLDTPHQGDRLKWCMTVAACMAFLYSSTLIEDQSPGVFSKIMSAICGNFFKNLECSIIKAVIRTVCRILCYLILYCHSPNLITTGVLVALISMDLTSLDIDENVKFACESLANGDFSRFCSNLIDLTGDPDLQSMKSQIPRFVQSHNKIKVENQGPKSFNDWSTAAKNAKWWVENIVKVFEWIQNKLFPTDARAKIIEIESKANEIGLIMALADEHICKCRTDKNYMLHKDTPKKHQMLVDKLVSYNIEEFPSQMNHLYSKLNSLLTRLQNINIEPPLDYSHRVEPLGIWIQGSPGCGKSFLSHYIVQKLIQRYGWEPYAHPIGSDHMDGYIDQEIHLFDDLGQNREEEDVALMCNLISSVPFIVPKASLETKGCRYNGKVVIATTNKKDFSTTKLLESAALQRRFPMILEIRPRDKYRRDDSFHRCRFNAVNATKDGSLLKGECWEINVDAQNPSRTADCWQNLNPELLMDDIYNELDSRLKVCAFMNQGNLNIRLESDGPDMLSDMFPEKPKNCDKFVNFVVSCVASFKDFVERNRAWFIAAGALGTVISLATITIPYIRKWMGRDQTEEDENFYAGKVGPLKLKDYKIPLSNQSPIDMKPISRLLVQITDKSGNSATGLAIGQKGVISYGHEIFDHISVFRDEEVNWKLIDPTKVTINGGSMDLVQYHVDSPIQFKAINGKIYDGDYVGDGYLIWKEGKNYCYIPVSGIRATSTLITQQGTTTQHTYSYVSRTWKGLCGAVLVGIVNGNPKILGIHVAGNKSMGMAARLFPMFDQGKATEIHKSPVSYFQPRKTKYEKSPVCSDNPTFGPAVLSRNDQRLKVDVEDITKHAASKYIGNIFSPDFRPFVLAKSHVTSLLSQVVHPTTSMSFEEAISSQILPIDWQTSPGLKYQGRTKKELVEDPKFKEDVYAILDGFPTFFTCYLKDELRPVEKISVGKTRAIEAGNFDYVCAWRMVMGKITSQLFEDHERTTGFAPGFNPYVYWDSMMENVRKYALTLDFKNYDGSLSPQVMRHAVDILASFHDQPEMVRMIHEPTIVSTNIVSDEEWIVDGGMCSGSPATTVLNTIVNLLVNHTILFSYGLSPSEVYVIGYGDDTIASSDRMVDISGIKNRYYDYFGMNVTGADKTDVVEWKPKEEIEFLKRSTALFPGTVKMVGKLNLQNMLGHIEWTTGSFQEQLDTFYMELSLHGKDVYEGVWNKFRIKAPQYRHNSFETSLQIMKAICLVF